LSVNEINRRLGERSLEFIGGFKNVNKDVAPDCHFKSIIALEVLNLKVYYTGITLD